MILLLYATGADPKAYEPWLRAIDNPFFNAIPGIKRYENWKITAGADGLPYSHFDFLEVGGPEDIDRVWFSDALDDFRKKWIAKWGYGSPKPSPILHWGYWLEGTSTVARRGGPITLRAYDAPPTGGEVWRVSECWRKHYAIGPAPAGETWRVPIERHPGPGFRHLAIDHENDSGARGAKHVFRCELLAAPA